MRLQYTKTLGKILGGLCDVLQNLRRQDEIELPRLNRKVARWIEDKVQTGGRHDIGESVLRETEQFRVGSEICAEVQDPDRLAAGNRLYGYEKVGERQVQRVSPSRLTPLPDVFVPSRELALNRHVLTTLHESGGRDERSMCHCGSLRRAWPLIG